MSDSDQLYDYFRQQWSNPEDDKNNGGEKKKPKKSLKKKSTEKKPKKSDAESEFSKPSSKMDKNSFQYKNFQKQFSDPADILHRLNEALETEEEFPTSSSEKERGNAFFKEGKYEEAIDCYSASIAIEPNCISFANRAMAFIKIKRFKDAEMDCTEAIGMDDEYVKAYSRRGTARKELGKILFAQKDFERALKLEPENKELKKQLNEIQLLIEKDKGQKKKEKGDDLHMIEKSSKPIPKNKINELKNEIKNEEKNKINEVKNEENIEKKQKLKQITEGKDQKLNLKNKKTNFEKSESEKIEKTQIENFEKIEKSKIEKFENFEKPKTQKIENESGNGKMSSDILDKFVISEKPESKFVTSPQNANSQNRMDILIQKTKHAVKENVLNNFEIPNNFFEFESKWRFLENDTNSQSIFLMKINPENLPEIFKNSFSKKFLLDIFRVINSHILKEDAEFAVQIFENLTKIQRFEMNLYFLSKDEKEELRKVLDHKYLLEISQIKNLKKKYKL